MTTSARQLEYLDTLGIQVWVERDKPAEREPENLNLSTSAESLSELYTIAEQCQRCEAAKTRKQVVFSDGPMQADWLIVGDFLSEQDESQGQPFTDNAARLLSEVLLAVGVNKQARYLTTSVKCHSAGASFETTELASCRPYLLRQIELVKPAVIVVLGEKATQSLLKTPKPLSALFGEVQEVDDISVPIVATHHPLHLLAEPLAKRQVWADIQLANSLIK
ncbi:MAG: uracil-DNA glycosylase [Cycloclasticus sp.]